MDNMITTQQGTVALRPIPEITLSIKRHVANIGSGIIGLGIDLADVKKQLTHGTWLPYLKSIGFAERTAENYIRVAQAQMADARLASLPYSKALALISAPAEDREQLLDEGVEDKSAAEVKRLVADLARERKEKQEAERSLQQKATYIDTLESHLRDQVAKADALHTEVLKLKDRPAEVREVEKVVTVEPADYQQMKQDLEAVKLENDQLTERLNDIKPEEPHEDNGAVMGLMAACNEFQMKCGTIPFEVDKLSALSVDRLHGYRFSIQGVTALCTRLLSAIDQAEMIEGGEVV